MKPAENIVVRGAGEHNLKNVDVTIPRDSLTVITGLSGSGKSSLAFDTIYAEGQRRYMESLSAYARQYLDQLQKPKVEYIEGLSPAISIEQKTVSKNPRSTVGTVTEIYDFLRVLYANIGKPHCPDCDIEISRQSATQIIDAIMQYPAGSKLMIMAPVIRGRKGEYRQLFEDALKQGFVRAKVNGEIIDLENPPKLKKSHKQFISIVIDRIILSSDSENRILDAVTIALEKADGLLEVQNLQTHECRMFSEHFSCPQCGVSVPEITPRLFSFNTPFGACKSCNGLGFELELDEKLLIPDDSLSIREGAIALWPSPLAIRGDKYKFPEHALHVNALSENYGIDPDIPYRNLTDDHKHILLHGNDGKKITVSNSLTGKSTGRKISVLWDGLLNEIHRNYSEEGASDVLHFFREVPCPHCNGYRLTPNGLAVKIADLHIGRFSQNSIRSALRFIAALQLTDREKLIAGQLIKEIRERLEFLDHVGLHYLTLDRKSGTLSGGEAQRIRLATQIGSQLTGVLYVLDEPSIGLHQRDNDKLVEALKQLRDLGNTLIVVEHDEHTMRESDYIIDMGPHAGRLGGQIIFEGTPKQMLANKTSITGQYLNGKLEIAAPIERRPINKDKVLKVINATEHNLKNVTVEFPLGIFTCVSGVSGSGKSTLVNDILYAALANRIYNSGLNVGAFETIQGLEYIDKIVDVDQAPIGRSPRSNPATYTGVFTQIRDLYAQLPDSQIRGYLPGRFSFNVKGGRCEECKGEGMAKVEMHFLPDTYVTCQVCFGRRFNRETLEILYKGKSIADVLEMTIEESCEFFSAQPSISHKMQTLHDVGLGYLTLGQSALTLSGGEAQRVKLAKELSKRSTGKTVYILDEPTTGLHFEDIKKLLDVLQALVNQGNTVIVIEHNLDVIKCADYVIDMGPEGGEEGGFVVATGTPEQIVKSKKSATGEYIKRVLKK